MPTADPEHRPWTVAAACTVAGVAVGAAARGIDVLVPVPEVGLAASALPTLHSTLLAAVVSVAVFSLWMRSVMVGLVSNQISPRAASSFLDDRFQHRLTWAMLGAIGMLATLLATSPSELPDSATPPLFSTVVAVGVTAAAVFTVLIALREAVVGLSVSRIVRQLADRAAALLPDAPVAGLSPVIELPDDVRLIHAERYGWVQGVDLDRLFAQLPPETRIDVLVRVGDFVTSREPLVQAPRELDLDQGEVRAAFDIADRRDPDIDLAFAIQQVVDVARSALASGSNDTSTAHEAKLHLAAVFEQMLQVGLPAYVHRDDDGREIVRVAEWDAVDHIRTALDRLRPTAAADPIAARELVGILERLAGAADEAGEDGVLSELGRQAHRLQTSAEAMLPDDLDPRDVRITIEDAELPPPPDEGDGSADPARDRDASPSGRSRHG